MPTPATEPLACALCGTLVRRVRRSFSDRCLSLVAPRMRCRCVAIDCGWEGLFPLVLPSARERELLHSSYLPRAVLEPSRGVGQPPHMGAGATGGGSD